MASVNFIKNMVEGKVDQQTHDAFVRYGMGEHDVEPFIVKKTGKNVKIWGSFEYCNVLVPFVLQNTDEELELSGGIPDLDDLVPAMKEFGIDDVERKRIFKSKKKMHVFKHSFSPDNAKKLYEAFSDKFFLCNIKSPSRQVKIKKLTLPDIRTDTSKFCIATLPKSDEEAVMNEFLFDCKDLGPLKSCTINHTYVINDIVVDEKLIAEDPARARKEAKRKGVLKRKITYNGDEYEKEYPFEV